MATDSAANPRKKRRYSSEEEECSDTETDRIIDMNEEELLSYIQRRHQILWFKDCAKPPGSYEWWYIQFDYFLKQERNLAALDAEQVLCGIIKLIAEKDADCAEKQLERFASKKQLFAVLGTSVNPFLDKTITTSALEVWVKPLRMAFGSSKKADDSALGRLRYLLAALIYMLWSGRIRSDVSRPCDTIERNREDFKDKNRHFQKFLDIISDTDPAAWKIITATIPQVPEEVQHEFLPCQITEFSTPYHSWRKSDVDEQLYRDAAALITIEDEELLEETNAEATKMAYLEIIQIVLDEFCVFSKVFSLNLCNQSTRLEIEAWLRSKPAGPLAMKNSSVVPDEIENSYIFSGVRHFAKKNQRGEWEIPEENKADVEAFFEDFLTKNIETTDED